MKLNFSSYKVTMEVFIWLSLWLVVLESCSNTLNYDDYGYDYPMLIILGNLYFHVFSGIGFSRMTYATSLYYWHNVNLKIGNLLGICQFKLAETHTDWERQFIWNVRIKLNYLKMKKVAHNLPNYWAYWKQYPWDITKPIPSSQSIYRLPVMCQTMC